MKLKVSFFPITAVIILICFLPLQVAAQVRVIDKPHYRFKNTGIETISKIELHDTITKMNVHVSFLPNWWIEYYPTDFIKPTNSNKRYHILGIENAELNKHLSTPSGEADYVLLFPPLDKSVKEIHYGDIKNDEEVIAIYNISLEKSFDPIQYAKDREITDEVARKLKDELKKGDLVQPADFDSDSFFNSTPSRLVGFIKGYWSDITKSYPIYSRKLNGSIQSADLKLYPNGYFEADINMEHPKMLSFSLLQGKVDFYIEPGQTLVMILDWEDILASSRYQDRQYILSKTTFEGSLAEVNRDLLKRLIYKPTGYEIEDRMNNWGFDAHRIDIEKRIDANLATFRKTDAEGSLCAKAKRLIENEIRASALEELLQFSMRYIKRTDWFDAPINTHYYSPLRMLQDDRSLLAVSSFDGLLSSLTSAGIFFLPENLHRPEFKPKETFKEFLIGEGKSLSKEEEALMSLIQMTFESSNKKISKELVEELREKKSEIEDLSRNYINEVMAYHNKYLVLNPVKDYSITLHKKDEIVTDSLGIEGILKDMFHLHNHYNWMCAYPKLQQDEVDATKNECMKMLSNQFMKNYLSEQVIHRVVSQKSVTD